MRISLSSLTIGARLGGGGNGEVHRIEGAPVQDDSRPMVIKRPHAVLEATRRRGVIAGMLFAVEFRSRLPAHDRARLDAVTVWPVALVEDGGQVVGCLMPLIPPDFFETSTPIDAPSTTEIRSISTLGRDARARQRLGIDGPEYDDDVLRLLVLIQLTQAIALLHDLGVVFGDINPNNAVFTFDPPQVLLIDCDATGALADTDRSEWQNHFAYWVPPECDVDKGAPPKALQTIETDTYKLALAFIRYLAPAIGVNQRMSIPHPPPPTWSPELQGLVTAALNIDPSRRPSVKELHVAARTAVRAHTAPPAILNCGLSRNVVVRGQDVLVSWHIVSRAPYEITVFSTDGIAISQAIGATEAVLRPTRSGLVRLIVTTKYDSTAVDVGVIECFDLPEFAVNLSQLPRIEVPSLTPVFPPEFAVMDIYPPAPRLSAMNQDEFHASIASLVSSAPDLRGLTEAVTAGYATMPAPPVLADLTGAAIPDRHHPGDLDGLAASLRSWLENTIMVGAAVEKDSSRSGWRKRLLRARR